MPHKTKDCIVYSTCDDNGKPIYYVRICPLETNQFPHGIATSNHFENKKDANEYANLVQEYIDAAFRNLD